MSQLVGIYGASGCGKTRFVEAIVKHISDRRFSSRGVCSPAIFEEGVKTGITAQLIPNGESRQLARLAQAGDIHVFGKWRMFPETMVWALDYLQANSYSDLWVIDELGPYEVEQGLGWAAILQRLGNIPSKVTLITYRPSLQTYFGNHYPSMIAFDLEQAGAAEKATREIDDLLSAGEISR
jgi:nucleoside-triphosphatase THEP1